MVVRHIGLGLLVLAAGVTLATCGRENGPVATAPATAPPSAKAPATTAVGAATLAANTSTAPATASAPTSATMDAQAVMGIAKANAVLELIKSTRSFEGVFMNSHGALRDDMLVLEMAANDVIKEGGTEARRNIMMITMERIVERADIISKTARETEANKVLAGQIRNKFTALSKS